NRRASSRRSSPSAGASGPAKRRAPVLGRATLLEGAAAGGIGLIVAETLSGAAATEDIDSRGKRGAAPLGEDSSSPGQEEAASGTALSPTDGEPKGGGAGGLGAPGSTAGII